MAIMIDLPQDEELKSELEQKIEKLKAYAQKLPRYNYIVTPNTLVRLVSSGVRCFLFGLGVGAQVQERQDFRGDEPAM